MNKFALKLLKNFNKIVIYFIYFMIVILFSESNGMNLFMLNEWVWN